MANEFKVKNGIKFPDNTIQTTAATGGGGSGISWSKKTANYTAVSGDFLLTDTTAGTFTITLPASPSVGNFIVFADAGSWNINNLIIARNGSTIEGLSEDLYLNISGIQVDLIYDGSTWEVFAFSAPSVDISDDTSTNTTQYLAMTRSTSGTMNSAYISSTGLTFNPNTGTLSSTNYNSLSDKNLKTNIKSLEDFWKVVDFLDPVSFNWISNNKKSFGFIAQEVENILPEAVEQSNNHKTVNYQQIIPFLLACVKDLKQEIEELKNGNT